MVILLKKTKLTVFVILALFGSVVSTSGQSFVAYNILDIGTLSDARYSWGISINNLGYVAGYASESGGNIVAVRKFFPAPLFSLGIPGTSWARDINDQQVIVGHKYEPSGNKAFMWEAPTDGKLTYLDCGGQSCIAWGINNQGKIVGTIRASGNTKGFVWDNGQMTILDNILYAYAINDNDQIACKLATGEACMLDLNTTELINLGSLGYSRDINDNGHIVGDAVIPINQQVHAFLYKDGAIEGLGTLGGTVSKAFGINNKDQVVGWSTTGVYGEQHAFIWENGVMRDLNDLISQEDTGWILKVANEINNAGQITGWGTAPNGATHGFILTPIAQ